MAERTASQLGEELFYDARLSLDGWFSCHSCHSDGHSTSRLNDNFSDGSFGTPKRILTLLGSGETKPWGWDGRQTLLADQVRSSISNTMAGPGTGSPPPNDRNIEALVTFIRSLPPAPSILQARGEFDTAAVEHGRKVFLSHGCAECHKPSTYSSPSTFDVSIHDEAGQTDFNPPSLRGVSQRGPYFHDNRAATLLDLLTEHDHGGASSLPTSQTDALILFLKSL